MTFTGGIGAELSDFKLDVPKCKVEIDPKLSAKLGFEKILKPGEYLSKMIRIGNVDICYNCLITSED